MPSEKLVSWIRVELSKGIPFEHLKHDLITEGWPSEDIDEAMNVINGKQDSSSAEYTPNPSTVASTLAEEPKKKKSIFIFIIVGLLVIAIGVLIFVIIRNNSTQITTPVVNDTIEQVATVPSSSETTPEINETVPENKTLVNGVVECGIDFNCFISSSQTCAKSNVTSTTLIEFSGMNITSIDYYELQGLKQEKCVFYLEVKEINVTAPIENENVSQLRAMEKTSEGKNSSCEFEINDLHSMLIRWNAGTYSSEDYANANCSGYFFQNTIVNNSNSTS
jgi:hypothetical protein